MEDAKLIEREADYRAYLVAASRSLPPPEPAPGVAPPPPSFVYPPTLHGPPPARLPPLPDLPQPQPLRLSVGLPYAACTRRLPAALGCSLSHPCPLSAVPPSPPGC